MIVRSSRAIPAIILLVLGCGAQDAEIAEVAKRYGAEPWIGIRFNNVNWFFIGTHDLTRTEASYRITLEEAKRIGLLFEELIDK